jgi:hypothetical protein
VTFPDSLGTDFDGSDEGGITYDFAYQDDPRKSFIQAMFRLLSMAGIWYSKTYGLGMFQLLLESDLTQQEIHTKVTVALMKDERVQQVEVKVLSGTLKIKITPHNSPTQPLTLSIDRVKGELLEVT